MSIKRVAIDQEIYEVVVDEARRQDRTIKGQIERMLRDALRRNEQEQDIRAGKTQIDPEAVRDL